MSLMSLLADVMLQHCPIGQPISKTIARTFARTMSHVSSLRSGISGYAAASRLLSSIRSLLASERDANEKLLFALSTTTRSTKTCTKRLRVELTENVDGLGAAGESVLVPSGYARNFLVPNRLARIQVGSVAAEDGKRRRGLSFAATKYSELLGKGTGAGARQQPHQASTDEASTLKEQLVEQQKKEAKKLGNIVRKLTENPVVFKGVKAVNGALETAIGPSDIRLATAKQLGIEIVDELIDMEGDVLDSAGDFLIPLKLVMADGAKAKLSVKVELAAG